MASFSRDTEGWSRDFRFRGYRHVDGTCVTDEEVSRYGWDEAVARQRAYRMKEGMEVKPNPYKRNYVSKKQNYVSKKMAVYGNSAYNDWNYSGGGYNTYTTSTVTGHITIDPNPDPVEMAAARQKAETPLEWLDRRVREVCVVV